MEKCLNCSAELHGKFCHECGQKVLEPGDRTLKHLVYQFLGSAFFLENNFVKNLWTLLTKPGKLPLDFIEGRRKRWMPPFSLFLLVNLFYFLYSPLSDLNLRLHEQLNQFHGRLATKLVNTKLQERGITMEQYAPEYNKKSTSYSNSLIILHLPIYAGFLTLIYYRKRYFFADHFIHGIYFFAFVLILGLIQTGLIYALMDLFGQKIFNVTGFGFAIFVLLYLFFSLKRTYKQKEWQALLAVFPVFAAFAISHLLYRAILFLIIFIVT